RRAAGRARDHGLGPRLIDGDRRHWWLSAVERFELVEREIAAAHPLAVLERVDRGPTGELHLARTEAEEFHRLAEARAYGLAVERLHQTPGDGGAHDPAAEGGHRIERVDTHDDVLEATLG